MFSSPSPVLAGQDQTCQAMPAITLTCKDASNWDFGEMTSAPTISGTIWSREKSWEKHILISRCRVDAWLEAVAVPWGLPSSQLAVLSTVLLGCLNPCPGAFLVHHTPQLRDNFCVLFRAFTPLQLKLHVCMDEKKTQLNEIIFLISDIQPASQGYWNKAGKLFFHSKPSGWHRLTLMLICWFLYFIFFFLRNTSSAAVNSDLLPLCAEHSFCTHIYYHIMPHCRCQEIIVILGVSTLF